MRGLAWEVSVVQEWELITAFLLPSCGLELCGLAPSNQKADAHVTQV